MKRFKKDNKRLIILIAVLALVIGYALVSTSLNITSSIFVKSAKWDIHFENVKVADGSATTENGATIKNKTTVEFSVGLNSPGEFYEFTVDAKNDGLIDGIIDDVTFDVYDPTGETKLNDDEIPSYVFKSITYEDGTEINKQDILRSGKKKVYKIRVAYTDEIEEKDINKAIDEEFANVFGTNINEPFKTIDIFGNEYNEDNSSEEDIVNILTSIGLDYYSFTEEDRNIIKDNFNEKTISEIVNINYQVYTLIIS